MQKLYFSWFSWMRFVVCAGLALGIVALCSAGDDKEKPKEKPFKYDVWCAFSDLMLDRPYVPPNLVPDPNDEHSRPGVERLSGFGRRGQWAHVIVDLKNATDPKDKIVYEGETAIELDQSKPDDASQSTYKTTYLQYFQIAPQTEKPYPFSIYCPELGWNETLTADITVNGVRHAYRNFHLHNLDDRGEQLIVVVSDQAGAFKYLGPNLKNRETFELVDANKEHDETPRQIASVAASELPTSWHDLTLASLIIIDGPPADGLSPDQWDALKAYAQAGGRVLIMAGKDPNRLKGAVEDLAGISVRGTTELPFLDQFGSRFPAPGSKSTVPVVEVTALGAGIVRRNSAKHVVEFCAKSYGAGMVAFIPFSLSDKLFENWPERYTIPLNQTRYDKNLFAVDLQDEGNEDVSTIPQRGYPYQRTVRQPALATLRNTLDTSFSADTPVATKTPGEVATFMAIYIACAVMLNYAVFFFLRRRESAWLLTPFWALGFTLVALYAGYTGATGRVTVNEVCVIEAGSGQGTGIGRTFMGVYAPRRDDYQIEFPALKIAGGETYDTEAAPNHLVNTEKFESRDLDYPSMTIREAGQGMKIERILFQTRDTRRFEVQHRAWLKDGLDLRFANVNGESDTRPAFRVQNNTGRKLYSPMFIKAGWYLDLAANPNQIELASGASLDSGSVYSEWRTVDDKLVEKFVSRFGTDGANTYVLARAKAIAEYLKNHIKQYAAGVFIAWADGAPPALRGASLPVKIGASGYKTEDPNIEGITLLVVPATATNRGGRMLSYKKNPPRALYATAFNPEDRNSGEWKLCARDAIPIRTIDDQNQKCVYLRLQFDREYGQYIYENKAAQLAFSLVYRNGRNGAPFSGDVQVYARDDAAAAKSDRFKLLEEIPVARVAGMPVRVKTAKFQFSSSELFTGSSIILKIKPVSGEGTLIPDGITIESVDLQLVDK